MTRYLLPYVAPGHVWLSYNTLNTGAEFAEFTDILRTTRYTMDLLFNEHVFSMVWSSSINRLPPNYNVLICGIETDHNRLEKAVRFFIDKAGKPDDVGGNKEIITSIADLCKDGDGYRK